MRLHGGAAARTMGGALEGPAAVFTGVSIDSRTLAPGDLFFAIRGPRFDGHTFVPDAFRAGSGPASSSRALTIGGRKSPGVS